MKIGIITFHFVSNQGAALQCYALQTWLEKKGAEVEVINYRPSYHVAKYAAWKNPFLIAQNNWKRNADRSLPDKARIYARGFIRGILASAKQTDKKKYQIFREFTEEHLHQTRKYKSLRQLRKNPPSADLYVAGSDQIWNPDITDYGFDKAYFMKFGSDETKRITYAVSPKEHYTDPEKQELSVLCRGIDAISVREENADLARAAECGIQVHVDPSLLLEEKDYRPLEAERLVKEPYLFVYGLENSSLIDEAAQIISRERGLKVINGSPERTRLSFDCEKVRYFGPCEFLSFMRHADYIVTNSFHGTAFSIIYKKPFTVVAHTTKGKRMVDLLKRIGLSSRLWDKADGSRADGSWKEEIDYGAAGEKLHCLQEDADRYFQAFLK